MNNYLIDMLDFTNEPDIFGATGGPHMINRTDIFLQFHPGHSREHAPDTITIHGTAGGVDADGLFRWWNTLPQKTDNWSVGKTAAMRRGIGFYHYLIDRDGTVYKMLDEHLWSFHSHAGRNDSRSIAVALVNPHRLNNFQYTDEQYHALHTLITDIQTRHFIKTIDSHNSRALRFSGLKPPQVTPCPGNGFDWERLGVFGLDILK